MKRTVLHVQTIACVQIFASQPSSGSDPLALTKGNATFVGVIPPSQAVMFKIKVTRFWQWNLVSGVLPILVCAILGQLVFFQDPADLGSRLSVIVTLFLALTAVQFVLSDVTPQSSYVRICDVFQMYEISYIPW